MVSSIKSFSSFSALKKAKRLLFNRFYAFIKSGFSIHKLVKYHPLKIGNATQKKRADALPQRIHCEKCGAILYEDMELKPPHEIVERYYGRCPKCGRKLSSIPIKVEIKRIK